MVSATYYFGAQPDNNQTIGKDILAKGIKLLRSSPAEAFPMIDRAFTTPQYETFCASFAMAVQSAVEGKPIRASFNKGYYSMTHKGTTPFMRTPTIIWHYDIKKDDAFISNIKDRFNAVETVAKKTPALASPITFTQAANLIKDTSPSLTTPASNTVINLQAYQIYIKLHRLADMFLRITQYPLVTGTHSEQNLLKNFVALESIDPTNFNKLGGNNLYVPKNHDNYHFNMNLPAPLNGSVNITDYYMIRTASDLPNDHGILFPFINELAKPDNTTVPYVVERYFKNLLGDTAEIAQASLVMIKAGWGVLKDTLWGNELAHLYSGIQISFETGGMMDVLATPHNIYSGYVITGGGFTLYKGEKKYSPVPFAELQSQFAKASPHASSLKTFYDLLNFSDDIDRQRQQNSARSTYDVGQDAREQGYNVMDIDKLRNAAKGFAFAGDQYLGITSFNVARVLNAISGNGEGEEKFPLHHLAILETDRMKRLMSSFGATAPSFLVPNGRSMPLEGSFAFKQGTGKNTVVRNTTRMFCVVVDWADACIAMSEVLAKKHVFSPIGTPLASRASSSSTLREFDGNNGASVLAALRSLAGVTVTGSSSGAGKRKIDGEEEEDDGPTSKKAKLDSVFSFD